MAEQESEVVEEMQRRVVEADNPLTQRLAQIHAELIERVPCVDRIACALYEPKDDLLKTFVNSTRDGVPIKAYQFRLSDSPSLSRLARERSTRLLSELAETILPNSPHSCWLLEQGYRSSFTIPIYRRDQLLGFVFFDSVQPAAFDGRTKRDLILYATLMTLAIQTELATIGSILAAARLARDFADLRDFETGAHLERMSRYARLIAKHLVPTHGLTDEYVERLFLFAPLHDIGKIGTPDAVLLKPGPLTAEERAEMQTHVNKGEEIVDRILADLDLEDLPDAKILRDVVGCHHEFLDGSGYPRRLSGEALSLTARIITVADILDALASRRPYKQAWTLDDALRELRRMADDGKLDSDCVAAVEAGRAEVAEIMARHTEH